MFAPTGAIVRRMRLAIDDEDGRTATVSGGGILVAVKDNAESRRALTRFAHINRVLLTRLTAEYADGAFKGRNNPPKHAARTPEAQYQCVGDGPALRALVGQAFVCRWEFAVSVRVPVVAGGSGAVKRRPPMGSAFGKPATTAATNAALNRDQQQRYIAAIKAGVIPAADVDE